MGGGRTVETLMQGAGMAEVGGSVEEVVCSLVAVQTVGEGCAVEALVEVARLAQVGGGVEEVVC